MIGKIRLLDLCARVLGIVFTPDIGVAKIGKCVLSYFIDPKVWLWLGLGLGYCQV